MLHKAGRYSKHAYVKQQYLPIKCVHHGHHHLWWVNAITLSDWQILPTNMKARDKQHNTQQTCAGRLNDLHQWDMPSDTHYTKHACCPLLHQWFLCFTVVMLFHTYPKTYLSCYHPTLVWGRNKAKTYFQFDYMLLIHATKVLQDVKQPSHIINKLTWSKMWTYSNVKPLSELSKQQS